MRLPPVVHGPGAALHVAAEGIPRPLPARLAGPLVQTERCPMDVLGDADAGLVPREAPIALPPALRLRSLGSTGQHVSPGHIPSAGTVPSWRPARTPKSSAVQHGGVSEERWRSRAHAASLSLPGIFGRNMAHSETGRCPESNIVPVAGANVLLQPRQRHLWTPLRSCPSRLERRDPRHGQASGAYASKNPASPSRDREGWRSAYAALRVSSASLEAAALAPSPYAMRQPPNVPVGRAAGDCHIARAERPAGKILRVCFAANHIPTGPQQRTCRAQLCKLGLFPEKH